MTNEPIIERGEVVAGQAPTAAWVCYEVEKDLHLVYLVGIAECVQPTHAALYQPTAFRRGIRLPLATLGVFDKEDPTISQEMSLMVLGYWPTYDKAKEIVLTVSNSVDDDEEQWVPRIRKLVKANRPHIATSRFELPTPLLKELLLQFLGEAAWALEQDGVEQLADLECRCGKRATVVRDVNTGEKSVLHPMPTCKTYDKLDSGEYLNQIPAIHLVCPCGAEVVLKKKNGKASMEHPEPACEKFTAGTPDTYVDWIFSQGEK